MLQTFKVVYISLYFPHLGNFEAKKYLVIEHKLG